MNYGPTSIDLELPPMHLSDSRTWYILAKLYMLVAGVFYALKFRSWALTLKPGDERSSSAWYRFLYSNSPWDARLAVWAHILAVICVGYILWYIDIRAH
jgi:hypothetical protein